MANILLVADLFLRPERTGIDLYYDKLVYWLPRLAPDLDFTLVSFGEPDQRLPWFSRNIRHVGLPVSRRQLFLASMLGMRGPLKTFVDQADLVHLLVPLPVRVVKPMLVTVYDLAPMVLPRAYSHRTRLLFTWALRRCAAQNSHFSVISDQTARDLNHLLDIATSRIHRIYLGIGESFRVTSRSQIEQSRAKYQLPERYFLYIGSMHKRKNLPTLLRAYRQFRAQDSTGTKLVLAGRMSLGGKELLKEIRAQGLGGAIHLPGYIDSADLPAVIGGAAALIYPSLYEGFGLPPLEAMACGTPAIASRSSSISEVTRDYALLCNPLDANSFADAMLKVVSDDQLQDELVKGGLDWSRCFSWQSTAEGTLQLYKTLLRHKAPGKRLASRLNACSQLGA